MCFMLTPKMSLLAEKLAICTIYRVRTYTVGKVMFVAGISDHTFLRSFLIPIDLSSYRSFPHSQIPFHSCRIFITSHTQICFYALDSFFFLLTVLLVTINMVNSRFYCGICLLRWRVAVKQTFQPYNRRYTSPNEHFEYSYPLIISKSLDFVPIT